MNCSFCHGHSRAARRMSRDEFSLVLDKLRGVTNYVYFHLMGEPLTHPDLPEFIKMAAERGFKPMITTNGTLLSRRGGEILASSGDFIPNFCNSLIQSGESGANVADVSKNSVNICSSPQEINLQSAGKICKSGGEDTTNADCLLQSGDNIVKSTQKPYLHKINISLHSFEGDDAEKYRKYLSDIANFAKIASAAGVIVVLRLWNKGFDGGNNDVALNFLREHIDGEWAENTRGLRIREKLFLEWGDRFAWPDSEVACFGDEVTCYGLRDHFGILSDGTIVPCCLDSDGVIALGNIFTDDIDRVLSSDRAVAMKRGFECRRATEELCRRCGYAQRFV